jgi:hypothetical protein
MTGQDESPLPLFRLTGMRLSVIAISCYIKSMTIEDLEQAVAKLPPDQFAKFRAWFEAFDAARFDGKIERDIKAGKLDMLGDRALDDFRKGRAREL